MMERPLDRNAATRVRIAFLLLSVFTIALAAGAYVIMNFARLQNRISDSRIQAELQGITDARQIDEALKRHPSNKILKMIDAATRVANETSAIAERVSKQGEPAALAKDIDFGTASRAGSTPLTISRAPAFASPSAMARPRPREEPVTSAVRPVRSTRLCVMRLPHVSLQRTAKAAPPSWMTGIVAIGALHQLLAGGRAILPA